jgi:hypothetical protein
MGRRRRLEVRSRKTEEERRREEEEGWKSEEGFAVCGERQAEESYTEFHREVTEVHREDPPLLLRQLADSEGKALAPRRFGRGKLSK